MKNIVLSNETRNKKTMAKYYLIDSGTGNLDNDITIFIQVEHSNNIKRLKDFDFYLFKFRQKFSKRNNRRLAFLWKSVFQV